MLGVGRLGKATVDMPARYEITIRAWH
jgi:hypothetical protein